jgi:hypothetical protein
MFPNTTLTGLTSDPTGPTEWRSSPRQRRGCHTPGWDFCTGEIILLKQFLLNDDYTFVRNVEINRQIDIMSSTGFPPEKLDTLESCRGESAAH